MKTEQLLESVKLPRSLTNALGPDTMQIVMNIIVSVFLCCKNYVFVLTQLCHHTSMVLIVYSFLYFVA